MLSAAASGARRGVARLLRAAGQVIRPARAVLTAELPRTLALVAAGVARGARVARPAAPGLPKLFLEIATDIAPGVWAYVDGRLDERALLRQVLGQLVAAAVAALIVALLCQLTAAWTPALQLLVVTGAAALIKALAQRCV